MQVTAAERAGAEAVLVMNSVPDGEPSGGLMDMGGDEGRTQPAIPAIMVTQVSSMSSLLKKHSPSGSADRPTQYTQSGF